MEELFNGQLSFADIDAEKFLHVRRAHADRRVNAMDRLTDDVIASNFQNGTVFLSSWNGGYWLLPLASFQEKFWLQNSVVA